MKAPRVIALAAWCVQCVGLPQEPARQTPADGVPARIKEARDIRFKHSSFTFVRIRYTDRRPRGHASWGGPDANVNVRVPLRPPAPLPPRLNAGSWATDYPDADVNLSLHFEHETGLPTDTNGLVLELTGPRLPEYPFIYMVEGGQMTFTQEEAESLREYLLRGGFLMVDDLWGAAEWEHLEGELNRVFPERAIVDLSIDRAIFHCYFDLSEKPQVPNVRLGLQSLDPESPNHGITWERADAREVHYRGWYDDHGRLMAVFCHNTDLGDGWERENVDERYYREFSLKKAYPMGINMVVHALSREPGSSVVPGLPASL